jgi:hypothetical protein
MTAIQILTSYSSKTHFYIAQSECLIVLLRYSLVVLSALCHRASVFSTNFVTLASNVSYEFCHSIIQGT